MRRQGTEEIQELNQNSSSCTQSTPAKQGVRISLRLLPPTPVARTNRRGLLRTDKALLR